MLIMQHRERLIGQLMGKIVHVVVDRPIGFEHKGMIYPVNYGYIPGVITGDLEDQDAYILGVCEPVLAFEGRVIAVIRRLNDREDKLVVAPDGILFHQAQIAEAVHFQEQFFITSIESVFRKSCGVIPVRTVWGEKEFLILRQTNGAWSFPKGHMEFGENEEQTALRELWEETGLNANLIPNSRIVYEYDIFPSSRKQVVLFLGETDGNVTIQATEIAQYKWVRSNELCTYLHPETYAVCKELL